jgi:hypothetical protein
MGLLTVQWGALLVEAVQGGEVAGDFCETVFHRAVQQHLLGFLPLGQGRRLGRSGGSALHRAGVHALSQMRHFRLGLARFPCRACGHDYSVAFSCGSDALFPACTNRRMVENAGHLVDQVFPQLPMRQ